MSDANRRKGRTMNETRYRVSSSDGRSYTEATWKTLQEAMDSARLLAARGLAVRVRDWRGGPVLFASGRHPFAEYNRAVLQGADGTMGHSSLGIRQ